MSDTASSLPSQENIVCYVRCRPLNNNESQLEANCINVNDSSNELTLKFDDPKKFSFNYIYSDKSTQSDLFQEVGLPMLQSFLKGYNGTILAYGQTGSGKTHTMLGPLETIFDTTNSMHGLIPNILHFLFNKKNEVSSIIVSSSQYKAIKTTYTLSCSCLEIYQEHIIDLLASETNEDKLSIREDQRKGMYIENLTEIPIESNNSAKEALMLGLKNRHVASTNMNSESSRSHLIFTIFLITSFEIEDGLVITRTSRLHMVDLAGSERQKSTEALGERIKEAGNINKSLSALGNVINALIELAESKTKHVPFRDSKLTHYLKDSLGGNSRTVIIGNVSQSFIHIQETMSTLMFIQRAKMIKNKVVIVENVNDTIKFLKSDIKKLNQKILELTEVNNHLQNTIQNTMMTIDNQQHIKHGFSSNNNNGKNSPLFSTGGKENKTFKHKDSNTINNNTNSTKQNNNSTTTLASISPSVINKQNQQGKYENLLQSLISKISQLFSYEDKIMENFQFLEMSSISAMEKFIVQKEIYDAEYKTTLILLNQKKSSHYDEPSSSSSSSNDPKPDFNGLSDKIKIFNLITQNKLLRQEVDVYKSMTQIFLQKNNIEEQKKTISSEFIQEFISTNNELKKFFTKNFQKETEYLIIDKSSLNKLKFQIDEYKLKEEQNIRIIDNLQSENFLLTMEIMKYQEKETQMNDDNNGKENQSKNKELFVSNLRKSLRKSSIKDNDTIVDELQNEVDNLILEQQRLIIDKGKIEELISPSNLNEIVYGIDLNIARVEGMSKMFDDAIKLMKERCFSPENSLWLRKELDNIVNMIFQTFKSKEKNRTIPKAIELMRNIQETLELHRYYIDAKSKEENNIFNTQSNTNNNVTTNSHKTNTLPYSYSSAQLNKKSTPLSSHK